MRRFLYTLLCILCCAQYAYAQPMTRDDPDDKGAFTFSFENDYFTGEDNGYTNGVRLAYLSPEGDIPEWVNETANVIPFFAHAGRRRWQFEIGQSMFTPDNISTRQLQPNDRPYAGWLYGSIGMLSDRDDRLDNLQLTLGMVGPASGAAQTQDLIHDITDSADPRGWEHQLHNEPGVVLTYERKWRGLYEYEPGGWGADLTPSVGGSIGNVYTHAAVGAVVRFGHDLPHDYGPPLTRPNLPGSDFFVPQETMGWYVFAGVEGRAVGRNIFLDGNTFRNSHSVDKEHLVGGVQAGVAFTVDNMRIAYTHVLRTQEFTQQREHDEFGAVTVSWRF